MIKAYLCLHGMVNVNREIFIREELIKSPFFNGSIPSKHASMGKYEKSLISKYSTEDNDVAFSIADIVCKGEDEKIQTLTAVASNSVKHIGNIEFYKRLIEKECPSVPEEKILTISVYRFIPLYTDEEISKFGKRGNSKVVDLIERRNS